VFVVCVQASSSSREDRTPGMPPETARSLRATSRTSRLHARSRFIVRQDVSERAEDRRARQAIRHEWEAAGRPACTVCGTAIEQRERVSLLWRAVVHPFCVYAKVARPSQAQMQRNPCPWYQDCPIPFRRREHESCVCPCVPAINRQTCLTWVRLAISSI
jgi:hypothetical protein